MTRAAGILLHPTSLPGRFGIGDLGSGADRFLDWAAAAGQSLWQVLPLGPTGAGNSPYTSSSAFAGNPLLISPERLVEEDLLGQDALEDAPATFPRRVDYGPVRIWKEGLLRSSWAHFGRSAGRALQESLSEFLRGPEQAPWLEDWARFAAFKGRFGGRPWTDWGPDLAFRDPDALSAADEELCRRDRLPPLRPVSLLPPVGARAGARGRARRRTRRRHPDLRRPRQRRRLGEPGPLRARRNGPADGGRRRSPRLLQRHRPALGQPALPVGSTGRGGLRVVDRPHPVVPGGLRPPADRPLPRLRGVLVRARGREDRTRRPLGPGAGAEPLRRRPRGARPAAHPRRGPRRHHRRGAGAARRARVPRHEGPAVRLLRPGQRVPAAPSRAQRRRVHGHPRQRHGPRLVRRP